MIQNAELMLFYVSLVVIFVITVWFLLFCGEKYYV